MFIIPQDLTIFSSNFVSFGIFEKSFPEKKKEQTKVYDHVRTTSRGQKPPIKLYFHGKFNFGKSFMEKSSKNVIKNCQKWKKIPKISENTKTG